MYLPSISRKRRRRTAGAGVGLLLLVGCAAASMYDKAITVFSPQGELLQVAYAEQAVQRGSLACAVSNGVDCVALCMERSVNEVVPAAEAEEEKGVEEGEGARSSSKSDVDKDRKLLRLRNWDHESDGKLWKIDEGTYLAIAGLSADGRILAGKLRVQAQNHRLTYGEAPTLEYLAKVVGNLQHRATLQGGTRPFGVSCVLFGMEASIEKAAVLTPRIFRTEPSGLATEWAAVAVGKGSDKALKALEAALGGEEGDGRQSTAGEGHTKGGATAAEEVAATAAAAAAAGGEAQAEGKALSADEVGFIAADAVLEQGSSEAELIIMQRVNPTAGAPKQPALVEVTRWVAKRPTGATTEGAGRKRVELTQLK